jgi:hypothetical protein
MSGGIWDDGMEWGTFCLFFLPLVIIIVIGALFRWVI